jgi:DNA-binding MarR family transcriptional regulator
VAQQKRRITELARVLDVTQPRVTSVGGSLVDERLRRRRAEPRDGRAVVLKPTESGGKLPRERFRRVAESPRTLVADRVRDVDALLGAESNTLHDPVGELEAAEAGTRR